MVPLPQLLYRVWPDSVWHLPPGAITLAGVPALPDTGELRFALTQHDSGWRQLKTLRGLAVTDIGQDTSHYQPYDNVRACYGWRTLERPRASGYAMEGRVTIGGLTYRAFTSSMLVQVPGGKLCDVAVLYVCMRPRVARVPA